MINSWNIMVILLCRQIKDILVIWKVLIASSRNLPQNVFPSLGFYLMISNLKEQQNDAKFYKNFYSPYWPLGTSTRTSSHCHCQTNVMIIKDCVYIVPTFLILYWELRNVFVFLYFHIILPYKLNWFENCLYWSVMY